MPRFAILLLLVLGAGCASYDAHSGRYSTMRFTGNDLIARVGEPAPLDPARGIADRDCGQPIDQSTTGGNLRCR